VVTLQGVETDEEDDRIVTVRNRVVLRGLSNTVKCCSVRDTHMPDKVFNLLFYLFLMFNMAWQLVRLGFPMVLCIYQSIGYPVITGSAVA